MSGQPDRGEDAETPFQLPAVTQERLQEIARRFMTQQSQAEGYRAEEVTPEQTINAAERLTGTRRELLKVEYMDLLEHSVKLGRVQRFNWSRPVGAAGLLSLGAGLGAIPSDGLKGAWLVLFLVLGFALTLCALLIRRERLESVENLQKDFDRWLSYWEENDATLREMRATYGEENGDAETPFWQQLRNFLKL